MGATYYSDATTTETTGIDIRPYIEGLSPKNTPVDKLLQILPQEGCDGPYYQWEGDAEQTVYVVLAEDMDNSETELTVDSTTGVFAGDIIEKFGSTNGEQIRISSVDDATTLTVVRACNNVTKDTASTDDKLYLVSKAVAEGGAPADYAFTPNEYNNYISIIACEVQKTFTDAATKYRTDRQDANDRQVMLAYKRAWNRAFLYSDRYYDSTNHFYYTGGLKFWVDQAESNKVDANMSHTHSSTLAAFTLSLWNNYLEDVNTYGDSAEKYIVCGTAFAKAVFDLYEGKIAIKYSDQLGFDLQTVHSIFGPVNFLIDPCMKGTYNEPRFWGISVDPAYLRLRTLIPHKKRDIDYGSNLQEGYQIYSHKGLAVYNPFTLVQYNISAAS